MSSQLLEHWKKVIKPLFPRQAFVRGLEKEDWIIAIDWLMICPEDPPSKRSRLIKIIIKRDVVDRYTKMAVAQQQKVDDQFLELIKERLKSYEPMHKIPRGGLAPQVEWVIETANLKIK